MNVPSAVIFVNNDIGDVATATLSQQLQIDETMAGSEFDARLVADPNYPTDVRLNNLRILVLYPTLIGLPNVNVATIVLFVKQGLASVLKHKTGSPGITLPINRINIFNLINDLKRDRDDCFDEDRDGDESRKREKTEEAYEHLPEAIRNMLIDPRDPSGVHDANILNEYTNKNWINRK